MLGITGTLRAAGIRGYVAKIKAATEESPTEAAEFLADQWRHNAHVVTGSYRASIYVQGHDGSDYAQRAGEARRLNPGAEVVAELPRPARKGAAAVGSAVRHSEFEEWGTSKRPPHPAFTPAVEATRREYPEITRRKLRP